MRIRIIRARPGQKSELMMTAMIDVVFLLLVFFIMTFRITSAEGDFNVEMPQKGPGISSGELPPIRIRLLADAEVEIDCDYQLKFAHAVDAITAVSGYLDQGQVVKLLEKIRFAPLRE